MRPTRESTRASRSRVNYAEAEALADITDEEDERDAGLKDADERKAKQKNAVAAFDDTSELDDEVEKVLAHRCAPFTVVPFLFVLLVERNVLLSLHLRTTPE